jgi:hypothetical protein
MIEKVATGLGHRVTWPDYRAAKRRGKVPSDKTVLTMFGGLRNVNDILGYPDVSLWEPDDFLDFGMRFLHTNGTEKFTTTGFDVLARRDRGPWTKNVSLQFDTWSNYKSKTLHNWEEKQARKTMRLTAYRKDISEGRLPAVFKQLDDDELLSKVARYRVATECAPHISEVRRLEAAGLVTPEGFSRRLKLDASYADEGYVEMVALSRNLLDDMWPPPLDARIYVSDQEIETAKAARRAREKDRRQTAVDTAQLSQAA